MDRIDQLPLNVPWLAFRLATGLSQREVERQLGWPTRGHLSLIERGIAPSAQRALQLRAFYARAILEPTRGETP